MSEQNKRVVVQLKSIADMTDEEIDAYADEVWEKMTQGDKPQKPPTKE